MGRLLVSVFGIALCGAITLSAPPLYAQGSQNISVSLQASKMVVEPGQIVTFTVTVRNDGSEAITDATASLTLDGDFEFKSASDDGDERRGAVEWEELMIPAGGSLSLNASAEVSDEVENDDDLFVAAFAAGRADEVKIRVNDEDAPDNDNARELDIELESSSSNIEAGDVFTYVVHIRNQNDRRLNDFDISLETDDALSILSASNGGDISDGGVTWGGLDIDGGERRELSVSVEAGENLKDNDVIESTVTTEGAVDRLRLQVRDNDRGRENILLFAFTEQDEVAPEEEISYTIHLRNDESEDQVVKVIAHLDHRSTFVDASDDGLQLERYLIEWQNIEIPQNETKTISLTVAPDPERAEDGNLIRTTISAGAFESRHVVTRVVNPETGSASSTASSSARQFSNVIDPQGIIAASQSQRSQSSSIARSPAAQASESNEAITETNEPVPRQASTRPTPRTLSQINDESNATRREASRAELSMQKRAGSDEAIPGDTVEFTVTVRNDGSGPARNIRVVDTFDSSDSVTITPVAGAKVRDNGITWIISNIPAGESWWARYQVTVDEDASHGDTISSTVSAAASDGASSPNSSHELSIVDRLPRTGIGAFSIATLRRETLLRNGGSLHRAADPMTSETTTFASQTTRRVPRSALILLVIVGMTIGSAASAFVTSRRR